MSGVVAVASSPHDVYFHVWHFIYQQIQLDNWFGNIVAGIVGFAIGTLAWPPTRKRLVAFIEKHVSGIHAKLDANHEEMMSQIQTNHTLQMQLAKSHHAEAMVAAGLKPERRKAPATEVQAITPAKGARKPREATK